MKNLVKVLIIGVDGGDPYLIKKCMEEGRLKTFKLIKSEGVSGILKSTIQPITSVAWASFLTGVNPGKHGIFDMYKIDKDEGIRKPVCGDDIKATTLYEWFDLFNLRVISLNIPMSGLHKKFSNEIIVPGMFAPENDFEIFPEDLLRYLKKINYKVEASYAYMPGKEIEYIDAVYDVFTKRKIAFKYLIKNYEWNIALCKFRITDLLGHSFWRFYDENHPLYDDKLGSKYGKVIPEAYEAVDKALKEILDVVSNEKDEVITFIMSDHGFGPLRALININEIFLRLNLIRLKSGLNILFKRSLRKIKISPIRLHEILLKISHFRKNYANNIKLHFKLIDKLFLSLGDIDWEKTLAYATGTYGGWGLVYLNGAFTHNGLREAIVKTVCNLRINGEHLTRKIYYKNEVYHGPYVNEAPDLIIEWNYGVGNHPIFSDPGIIIQVPQTFTGTHRLYGIFYAYGPSVAKGVKVNVNIVDILPTIMHIFDLPIPEILDGKILKKVFRKYSTLRNKSIKLLSAKTYVKLKVRKFLKNIKDPLAMT